LSTKKKKKKEAATADAAGTIKRAKIPGSQMASELPLTLAPRKPGNRATVLVSSSHPVDLAGEVGAVGCITVAGNTLVLDIAGHRYSGRPIPVASHCVLHVTEKEARIESVANVCLELKHLADVVMELGGSLGSSGAGVDAKSLFEAAPAADMSGRRSVDMGASLSLGDGAAATSGTKGKGKAAKAEAAAASFGLGMIGRARTKGGRKKRK